MMRKIILTVFYAFIMLTVNAQSTSVWRFTDYKNIGNRTSSIPSQFKNVNLKFESLKLPEVLDQSLSLDIPTPTGEFENFIITSTPIFAEGLAAKYPQFGSYSGISSDKTKSIKISKSPYSIHVMVTALNGTTYYIDPIDEDRYNYIVYYRHHLGQKKPFTCFTQTIDPIEPISEIVQNIQNNPASKSGDCQMRTYRLALACTGEYARFHGGTVEKVLAAYNTSMTRVNGIYERDVSVRMILIDNTDKLIYFDPATDPYNNNNGSTMLGQNRTTCNNVIGTANYDIGHVFSTGGGGIAQLRAPCGNSKAEGVTGSDSPAGDPFDVDYVAHEMGHQFGANHSFNNSCGGNINENTAFEPGSGSSIMGYAGICPPNVANNSDAHFHAISIEEINNFITSNTAGNRCATLVQINNIAPTVNTSNVSYNVPTATSFFLEAKGEDADGDALTYCWEQMNNQIATMPPRATSTSGPSFRSIPPLTSPRRYFPDLARKYSTWEVLPTVNRSMDFRCTVRDNHEGKGCTAETDVKVNFISGGPFEVTQPNTTSISWVVGSQQVVKWNKGITDATPINTSHVDIYLSIDGGVSYPHVVLLNTPNDGEESVVTPPLPSNTARIMVVGHDNIFFDVSNTNFRITTTFSLTADKSLIEICNDDTQVINLDLKKVSAADQTIILSTENLPAGLTAQFDNATVMLPGTSKMTLSGLQNLQNGKHVFTVKASTNNSEALYQKIELIKYGNTALATSLLSPMNGLADLSPSSIKLSWQMVEGVKDYQIQVSDSPTFNAPVVDQTTTNTNITVNLQGGKIYFWKVKANSPCFSNTFGNFFSFRTSGTSAESAVIIKNEPLLVNRSESGLINNSLLDFLAAENALIYVTENTINGGLSLNGQLLNVGDIIYYSDITTNKLSYTHNGNTELTDNFKFDLIDGEGRWLPNQIFRIIIKTAELNAAIIKDKPLLCFGINDAKVIVSAYGGVAPYQYSLDNGINFQASESFENLGAGTYKPVLRDALMQIIALDSFTLISPPAIILNSVLDKYDIKATALGGEGTISYSLDNVSYVPEGIFNDPGNGTYTIYARDEHNCTVTNTITIDIPVLSVSPSVLTEIKCFGERSQVVVTATGGILPYTYSLDGTTYGTNSTLFVPAGNQVIYVKDGGGKITTSDTIRTNNPSVLALNPKLKKLVLTASVSGGTPPYQYSLDGNIYSPDSVIILQSNGSYRVYVKDSVGCIKFFNITVNVLVSATENTRNLTCYKKDDGYMRITANGGAIPLKYALNGGALGDKREWSNLPAGLYNYLVVDNRNDSITGSVTIIQPDSLIVNAIQNQNTITLEGIGGTQPYTYSVDNDVFLNGNVFDDLPSGTYKPTIKDKNGCLSSHPNVIINSTNDGNGSRFFIHPNPSTDYIFISSNLQSHSVKLDIFDQLGRLVKVIENQAINSPIDIIDFPAGSYYIRILTKNSTINLKFIKS